MRWSAQGGPSPGATAGLGTLVSCRHSSEAQPEADARGNCSQVSCSRAAKPPRRVSDKVDLTARAAKPSATESRGGPCPWADPPRSTRTGSTALSSPPSSSLLRSPRCSLPLTGFLCAPFPSSPVHTAGLHAFLHLILRPPLTPGAVCRPSAASLPWASVAVRAAAQSTLLPGCSCPRSSHDLHLLH